MQKIFPHYFYPQPAMKYCSRTKDAKAAVLEMGENRSQMLKQILEGVYLRRDKAVALEDDLPTK